MMSLHSQQLGWQSDGSSKHSPGRAGGGEGGEKGGAGGEGGEKGGEGALTGEAAQPLCANSIEAALMQGLTAHGALVY